MVGALASHATVLGIEVQEDGGALFALACVVLAASALVLWLRLPFLWLFVVYLPSRLAGLLVWQETI